MAQLLVACAAALAAAHKPVPVLEVTQSGKAVIPETSYGAIEELVAGSDGVVIVGGYGTGVGLSTAFNTAARAEDEDALLRGFPVVTTRGHRTPSVWLSKSGLETPDGRAVLLMSCEGCFYHHNASVAVSSVLFRFMAAASHHLVFHSVPPSDQNVNRLEYLLRQAEWADLSAPSSPDAVLAAVASGDAAALHPKNLLLADGAAPAAPGVRHVTWAWTGIPAQVQAFDALMAKHGLHDAVQPHVLPAVFDDTKLQLLKDVTRARVGDVTAGFREACVGLVVNAAGGSLRDFELPPRTVYQFLKTVLEGVEANQLPSATPDLAGLMQASLHDRKMYAVGVYKDVLRLVGSGDAEWVKRVVPELEASQPNLIAALADESARHGGFLAGGEGVKSHLIEHLGVVAAGTTTQGAPAAAAPPATQQQYQDAETMAWRMALDYFTDGFSTTGAEQANAVRTAMRTELTAAKDLLRDQHSTSVKAYLKALSDLVVEAVDGYIAEQGIPALCSDESEAELFADFRVGTEAMFAKAAAYWPSYDAVAKAEAKAAAYISSVKEGRRTARNQQLHDELEKAVLEKVQDYKSLCRLPEDGAPARDADLAAACDAAGASAQEFVGAVADALAPAKCKEPAGWVRRTDIYGTAAAKLDAALQEVRAGMVEGNDIRFEKACNAKAAGIFDEAVQPAFDEYESVDCPDEEALAGKVRRLQKDTPHALRDGYAHYGNAGYQKCLDALQEKIEVEWDNSKMRIEKKLFGSEEVRAWRGAWSDALDAAVEDCTVCRFHAYFTERFLVDLAHGSAPTEIAGQPLGDGFRAGVIRRAVKKEMADHPRGGDLEWVVYTAASAVLLLPVFVKLFV
eukprot:TRINITY_DN20795_c0_g1_i1.p1 TRINITY_DN20795_c0_g1~~TRINITY_DN20795_c0_g1_i1.p1  ORF type:complete len:867 (+),score=392.21 TRINITY_DN20795_c0_g1_i1:47-2602(+)